MTDSCRSLLERGWGEENYLLKNRGIKIHPLKNPLRPASYCIAGKFHAFEKPPNPGNRD